MMKKLKTTNQNFQIGVTIDGVNGVKCDTRRNSSRKENIFRT